jgi:hypothetical protein
MINNCENLRTDGRVGYTNNELINVLQYSNVFVYTYTMSSESGTTKGTKKTLQLSSLQADIVIK